MAGSSMMASLHLVTSLVNHTPDSSCPHLLHTHTSRPTMWRQDRMGASAQGGFGIVTVV